jgi:diguanylate cyclase (GGDEF)-like protein
LSETGSRRRRPSQGGVSAPGLTPAVPAASSLVPVGPDSTVPGAPPAEAAFTARAAQHAVLVVDGQKGNARRAEDLVRALGFPVQVADDAEAARRLVDGPTPPALVLVGLPGGEAVAKAVRARGRERPSVIVAAGGETAAALALVEQHGGDAFVLRPYKRDALAAALFAALIVREERARVAAVEAELAGERSRLLRHGDADPSSGLYHFEFFKKILVIELKRAKRFGYPLAAMLIALDDDTAAAAPAAVRGELRAQITRALRASVRDIDLPVDYADGRFLVLLPHTDAAGAERAGRRLEAAVRGSGGVEHDGRRVRATVSVGIAAVKGGQVPSFARLMRDASLALRAAQLKGGARVVVKA